MPADSAATKCLTRFKQDTRCTDRQPVQLSLTLALHLSCWSQTSRGTNIQITLGITERTTPKRRKHAIQIARDTPGRPTLDGPLTQPQRHHAPARPVTPTYSFRCLLASWLFLSMKLGAWQRDACRQSNPAPSKNHHRHSLSLGFLLEWTKSRKRHRR